MSAKSRKRVWLERDTYTLALERINRAYDLFDTVGVAFSGGKDSTAVLQLTLEVARDRDRLPLRVVHFDEECSSDDTIDYVRRISKMDGLQFEWWCLPLPHQNAASREKPWWFTWDPELEDLWCQPPPPEGIFYPDFPEYPVWPKEARWTTSETSSMQWPASKYGQVGLVMGIRADESLARFRAVVKRDYDNFISNAGVSGGAHTSIVPPAAHKNISKVYPIYDWSVEDVWRAPLKFGWDYNRQYEKMSMFGISPAAQRVAPPFHAEGIQALRFWQACYPDLWDRMTRRVPGVNTAARYARTELYNFGKPSMTKADHLTWEDYIRHILQQHPAEIRAGIARRIKYDIEMHHRQTSDPIVEEAPHPQSGVCWRYLSMIASRGDPMNRKTPSVKTPGTQAHVRQRERYEAERQRMLADGRLDPRRRSGAIRLADEDARVLEAASALSTPAMPEGLRLSE